MFKRWQVLGKSVAVKTAIAFTLVLSLVALPLPGAIGWAQGKAEAAPPEAPVRPELNPGWLADGAFNFATSTPPGQKKRRGMAGSVASFATSTSLLLGPVTTLTIGSQFGDVQVLVTEDTVIFSPFHTDLTAADLDGYRLAIHFAKEDNEDGTRTALRIMVIPGKAARTHSRGVIKAKSGGDEGEFEFEGEDGEIIELGDDADNGDLEEGDEVIVVTQTVTDGEGEGDGEDDGIGPGKPKKIARGLQKSSKIFERLDRIANRLSELGDSPATERLRARVEKFKARHVERFNDINTRFSGEGSSNRGKGRPVNVGSTDFGPSDGGDDDGKQNRGRNRGRSGDLFPQGDDTDDDDTGEDDGNKRNRGKGKVFDLGKRGRNN